MPTSPFRENKGLLNTHYRQHICKELHSASQTIADEWLKQLEPTVQEDIWDIFPTEQYLDHIPSMIDEVGSLLAEPDENVRLLSSIISRKALELGSLRHQQKATISQLLHEYDILANILEDFIRETTNSYDADVSTDDAIALTGTMNNIVRYILQSTVDSFTEKYMATIQYQTEKIVSFNKFVGHELRKPLQSALLNTEMLIETCSISDLDTEDLLKVQSAIQSASLLITNIEQLMQSTESISVETPATQSIQLDGLVTDIAAHLSSTLDARGFTLRCAGEPRALMTGLGKLRMMQTNLITNSVKYSDTNKDERLIDVSREDRPGKITAVSVRDNGLGIPADQVEDVLSLRVRAGRELDAANDVSGEV